ncbi:hypothetical protein NC651_036638 [Populus alba x Populus x berolinensis]|nr:hypothetical protein NC651_036638 [Populus alba x Populus x berolinensis]
MELMAITACMALSSSSLRSAFEAEFLAVREALKLAWDKGLKKVILESDSETVVKRIRNQVIRQPKNQLEAVILDVNQRISLRLSS